jgi:hypothetical protein
MSEGRTDTPPSWRTMVLITLGAGIAATLLTLLVVLPAEFGRDPTGFGKLTGLDRLAPDDHHEHVVAVVPGTVGPAQVQAAPFRSDEVEIVLVPKGDKSGRSELEYKVAMTTGGTIVYTWQSDAADGALYSDFHAETKPEPDVKVYAFGTGTAPSANGSLTAPIDAPHGWYFQNKSDKPITIRLKLAGYYELIAPGESGNAAGILPLQ